MTRNNPSLGSRCQSQPFLLCPALSSLSSSSLSLFLCFLSLMASISITTRSFCPSKAVDFKKRKLRIVIGYSDKSEPDAACSSDANNLKGAGFYFERRRLLLVSSIGVVGNAFPNVLSTEAALASEFADMPALRGKDYGKSKMRYPDYTETQSGLQYKDLRVGEGPTAKMGETVVVDWDGYTIGYYGRIFEARNKTKGGSFEGDDKDFFKFKLGSQQVIPAFEEAVVGMAPGGIRR